MSFFSVRGSRLYLEPPPQKKCDGVEYGLPSGPQCGGGRIEQNATLRIGNAKIKFPSRCQCVLCRLDNFVKPFSDAKFSWPNRGKELEGRLKLE